MTEEKARFGEQAINKIAEVALARRLEDAEKIQVRVKTDLNRLAHGEVESIAILLQNLLLHQNLRVELLQLQIGLVVVKPWSALRGNIQLVQPSEGSLHLVIHQDALTDVVNSTTFRERLDQRLSTQAEPVIKPKQVQCSLLSEDSIVFHVVNSNAAKVASTGSFTATPVISGDRQTLELHHLESQDQEVSLAFMDALVTEVSDVLNLREFARQGMSLQIQQLQISAGKLTIQATAQIEKFPAS